jgi:superfamily II DNA helicase RecQ
MYPVLRLTEKSYDLLFAGEAVMLIKPYAEKGGSGISHYRQENCVNDHSGSDGISGIHSDDNGNKRFNASLDQDLLEKLRNLRRRLANEEGIPPYMVFHDSSLKEMAARFPENRVEFRSIEGVGDRKLEKYGDLFLREIDAHSQNSSKAREQKTPVSVQGSSSKEMTGIERMNHSSNIGRAPVSLNRNSET